MGTAICDAARALSGLLDWRQFWNKVIFVQFWREREKMQNCLHCSLTPKNSKWGFSLKSFIGRTPSWPPLTSKAVSKFTQLSAATFIRKRYYQRLNLKSPHAANSELR